MATLTKTQTELLRRAKGSETGTVGTQRGYITGGRKSRPYGARESNAAVALRDLGLLAFKKHERGIDTGYASNGTHHYTSATWTITDAGRIAAAALPPLR